jgi:HEAT repeat protein
MIDQEKPSNLPDTRRPSIPMLIVAALFIIVPFMFWYGTWFGRELREGEIERYLNDSEHPSKIQHALTQAAERIERGDQQIKRLYPKIASLADNSSPEIRMTAAWVMGQDNGSQEFHDKLLSLIKDSNPLVRRNTALSLTRFSDQTARPELVMMLHPYTVRAEREGTISIILQEGDESIAAGKLLARITESNGQVSEVRSPLAGYLKGITAKDAAKVTVGDELVQISPEPKQVWEALRALYLIGESEDIPDIESYTHTMAHMDAQIRQQAEFTVEAIRKRSEAKPQQ